MSIPQSLSPASGGKLPTRPGCVKHRGRRMAVAGQRREAGGSTESPTGEQGRSRHSNSDAEFAGALGARRRRPQKNCNCDHRGGTQWTPRTASPAIQNRGCERKRPETSDRADGANGERQTRSFPLFNGPRVAVWPGRDLIGPFQLFPASSQKHLRSGWLVEAVRPDGCGRLRPSASLLGLRTGHAPGHESSYRVLTAPHRSRAG